jgi:flagellar motor switch protein FliN/FliY
MRSMRLAAVAIALGAWLGASLAQQAPPPADRPAPAAPPATRPPPAAPPAPAPAEEREAEAESAEEPEEVFIPTEELQPDAAVTFPVDI